MAAEELLRFALFKEVVRPERRKRRKLNGGAARSDDESESDEEEEEELLEEEIAAPTEADRQRAREKAERLERRNRRGGSSAAPAAPEADIDAEEAEAAEALADGDVEMAEAAEGQAEEDNVVDIQPARLDLFRERLSVVFESDVYASGFLAFEEVLPLVNEGLANEDMFGTAEGKAAVQTMHDRNELMVSDGDVYKV